MAKKKTNQQVTITPQMQQELSRYADVFNGTPSTPSMFATPTSTPSNLSASQIEEIYNSTPTSTPSNLSSADIENIYNNTPNEIPTLQPISKNPSLEELQNLTSPLSKEEAYKHNYNNAINELQGQLADTNANRTEGETNAIQTYLEGLQGLQKEVDKYNRPKTTTTKKVDSKSYAQALGEKALELAKDGTLASRGYSLSPNEQRDLQRANNAMLGAYTKATAKQRAEQNAPSYVKAAMAQAQKVEEEKQAKQQAEEARAIARQQILDAKKNNVQTDATTKTETTTDTLPVLPGLEGKNQNTQVDLQKVYDDVKTQNNANNNVVPTVLGDNKWEQGLNLERLGANYSSEEVQKIGENARASALANKTKSQMSDADIDFVKSEYKKLKKLGIEGDTEYERNLWKNALANGEVDPQYAQLISDAYYNTSLEGAIVTGIGKFGETFAKPVVASGVIADKVTGNNDWNEAAKSIYDFNDYADKYHKGASTVGGLIGTATLYSGANGIAENLLGELSPIKNIILGQGIDNILDTTPELAINYANGKYTKEDGSFDLDAMAKDFAISNGLNLAGNVGAELFSTFMKNRASKIPTLEGNGTPIADEVATKTNLEQLEEAIAKQDDIVKQADDVSGTLTKEEIDEILNTKPQTNNDVPKVEAPKVEEPNYSGDDFLKTFDETPKEDIPTVEKPRVDYDTVSEVPKVEKPKQEYALPKEEVPEVKNIDEELRESAEAKGTKGTYKETTTGNKELDDNINSIYKMFGDGNTEDKVAELKSLLNEYSQSGDENILAQARQIASELDEAYSGAKYVNKRGVETKFENSMNGTFSNQVDDFADRLRNVAEIRAKEMPHLEDISKRVDDIVNDFGATDEMVDSAKQFKQSINNLLNDPTDENFKQFVEDATKMYNTFDGSEKYKSKYMGKVKADKFTGDDIMGIVKEAEDIFTKNDEKWKTILDGYNAKALENAKTPGGKVSQTFTNTYKNSGFADADLVDDAYKYADATEKDSMDKAGRAITDDFEGCERTYLSAKNLADKKEFVASDVDTMMLMWQKYKGLKEEAIASGDMIKAQQIQNKINTLTVNLQRQISQNAQSLQALAKWSRGADGAIAAANARVAKGLTDKDFLQLDDAAKRIYDKLNELKESDLWDDLVNSATKDAPNTELEQKIDDIIREAIDGINSKNLKKKLDDRYVNALKRTLYDELTQMEDLSNVMEQIKNIGGIDIETEQAVRDLFEQAEKLDYNSKARVELENEAYSMLANSLELEGTFREKVDAWRYFAMLSNPKTHIRNEIGNLTFGQITNLKDDIKAGLEKAYNNYASKNGKELIERTSTTLDKLGKDNTLYSNAVEDADNIYRLYKQRGRYINPGQAIDMNKNIFNNDGIVGKALNKLTNGNGNLLDYEDWTSFKRKYGDSLARYLKANGYDESILKSVDEADMAFVEKARTYAIDQAERAVFHQDSTTANAFTKFVNDLRNSDSISAKATGTVLNATVPFVKTPVNVMKSVFEYSPLEFAKAFSDVASKKGVDVVIDDMAKGLTGSALFGAGMLMGKSGLISVKANAKDQANGKQNYSLNIGDASFSFDSMPPIATILLAGAALTENHEEDELGGFDTVMNALSSIQDPIFETTMLQGLMKTINSTSYGKTNGEKVQAILGQAGQNLMGQFVPSELGNISRALDNNRRSTYTDNLNTLGKSVEYGWNSAKNKIPGLNQLLGTVADKIPAFQNTPLDANQKMYDTFGNELKNFDYDNGSVLGKGLNLAYQHLSPGYLKQTKSNEVLDYLGTIYDENHNEEVYPQDAPKKFNYDGGNYQMTEREYSAYQKAYGDANNELVSAIIKSADFQNLDADAKTKALKELYKVAGYSAQASIIGEDYKNNDSLYKMYKNGNVDGIIDSLVTKYQNEAIESEMESQGYVTTSKTRELYKEGNTEALATYNAVQDAINNAGYDMEVTESLVKKRAEMSDSEFNKYLGYVNSSKNAGYDTSEAGWKAYQSGKYDKFVSEYKAMLEKYDVNSTDKLYEIWDKEGLLPLVNELKNRQAEKAEKDSNMNTPEYHFFENSGYDYSDYEKYQNVKTKDGGIPTLTPQQYVTTVKKIDTSGNNSIEQKEMLEYFDKNNVSQAEAKELWKYGDWKTIPVLKKNGKWGTKKVK